MLSLDSQESSLLLAISFHSRRTWEHLRASGCEGSGACQLHFPYQCIPVSLHHFAFPSFPSFPSVCNPPRSAFRLTRSLDDSPPVGDGVVRLARAKRHPLHHRDLFCASLKTAKRLNLLIASTKVEGFPSPKTASFFSSKRRGCSDWRLRARNWGIILLPCSYLCWTCYHLCYTKSKERKSLKCYAISLLMQLQLLYFLVLSAFHQPHLLYKSAPTFSGSVSLSKREAPTHFLRKARQQQQDLIFQMRVHYSSERTVYVNRKPKKCEVFDPFCWRTAYPFPHIAHTVLWILFNAHLPIDIMIIGDKKRRLLEEAFRYGVDP